MSLLSEENNSVYGNRDSPLLSIHPQESSSYTEIDFKTEPRTKGETGKHRLPHSQQISENWGTKEIDDPYKLQLGPIHYLNGSDYGKDDDDDEIIDDREEEEIIQSLDHRAKLFGRFFRAAFGALNICLLGVSFVLLLFQEGFSVVPNRIITCLLHAGLMTTYILSAFRSMRSKRNIRPKEGFSGDYYVEDIHTKVYWINLTVTFLTTLLWLSVFISNSEAFTSLPWIKRLLVIFYAGMGPAMLFSSELSLTLIGTTLAEITALWTQTQKFKSI